eukprot:gene13819-4751_t
MPLPSVFSSKQNRVKGQKREPASPKKLQFLCQSTVNAPAHFCHNFCTKKMPCIYEETKHQGHSRETRLPDIVPSLPNKASIKRKLKECGTYIDDELPEYIMVMIANKRKSQQMVDDLSLFLGEETDGFVKWLFQTLGKLQSAAQDAVEDDHIKESETRESCEAEPDHGIENTAQVDQTGKEVKENINEGEKPSIDRKEKSRKDKSREDNDGKRKEAEKEKNDESIEIETKSDNKVIAEKIHEDTRSEVRKRRQDFVLSRKTSESVTGKKDRNEENKKDSTKKRRLSSSKTEAIDKIAAEKDNSDHGHAESLQSAVAMQKIRPSLPRSRQATGLLVKKAIKEANQSVTVKPRKQSASEGQLEVAASSAENKVERRVHLKRGRSNVSESEPLEEKEEDVEADFENEESVGKKKKTGEPDKHQVILFIINLSMQISLAATYVF